MPFMIMIGSEPKGIPKIYLVHNVKLITLIIIDRGIQLTTKGRRVNACKSLTRNNNGMVEKNQCLKRDTVMVISLSPPLNR